MSVKAFIHGFGTIRNNTALKLSPRMTVEILGFGTIRNNTALKHLSALVEQNWSFGTIRNNTALKHSNEYHKEQNVLEPFETTQL